MVFTGDSLPHVILNKLLDLYTSTHIVNRFEFRHKQRMPRTPAENSYTLRVRYIHQTASL